MAITSKIKRIAKQKGITIDALAKAIGTSRQSLSNILNRGDMKVSMLEDIALVLGVTVPHFYIEEPDIPDRIQYLESQLETLSAKVDKVSSL